MIKKELLDILKCVLTGDYSKPVVVTDWKKLISLAKVQNVVSCVAYYVEKLPTENKPEKEIVSFLKKALFQATIFSTHQLNAVKEMQEVLERKGIYTCKMKGSCTKLRYETDAIRTMGDIDILYKPEQHKEFRATLENDLNYGNFQEGRKNDTYDKEPSIHIEAHRELVSADSFFAEYYKSIWDRVIPQKDHKYAYEMTLEDEYIYNFIHLTEHFKNGGIGVRFIMDIYVYEHLKMDWDYVHKTFDSFGLLGFYKNIVKLSNCWFGNEKNNELTERLSNYIFAGGVFGSSQNAGALEVANGGKLSFIIRVCFPSYKNLVSMFPWLKGKKLLLPVAWIIRAFRAIFKRRNNVKAELNLLQNGNKEEGEKIRSFYSDCGFPDNIYN